MQPVMGATEGGINVNTDSAPKYLRSPNTLFTAPIQ